MNNNTTNARVRAELERIDPEYFGKFHTTDWDAFFELAEDHENMERFVVMLAESQAALGEIQKTACIALVGETRASMISKLDSINELARTYYRGTYKIAPEVLDEIDKMYPKKYKGGSDA